MTRTVENELVQELGSVADQVAAIGGEHRKCLACHCYREVAEEGVVAIESVAAHATVLFTDPEPGLDALEARAAAVRELLAASEGTHG